MYDDDLQNLEEWLRRLKVEYDIFFNGSRKRPPDDLKLRVEKLVKRLAESHSMTFSQRFRYNTLVSRFYVYRDLWRRTLMERETGEDVAETTPAPKHTSTSARNEKKPGDEVQVSITDPAGDADKVRQLYDALLDIRGKQANEPPRISYEQFSKYITAQTLGIRGKHQCSKVVFTIALDDDSIRFTAAAGD